MESLNWKKKLERCESLQSGGTALLYDRIVLLKNVSDDVHFLKHCRNQNKQVQSVLAPYVSELTLKLSDLFDLLAERPERDDWNKPLNTLFAEVFTQKPAPRKDAKNWKQLAAEFEDEVEALRRDLDIQKEIVRDQENRIFALQTENERLEELLKASKQKPASRRKSAAKSRARQNAS